MMHVAITNDEDQTVVVRVSGPYNPEILNDVKNRAIEAWNELFVVGDIEEAAVETDP